MPVATGPVLGAIPYTTFPDIDLGPVTLRTFGMMVALGILIGAWLAARHAERFGVPRDETYRVATWMVLAGIIGSRLTWVATHTDQIDSPLDVIAIWEGGIQFSGGFIAAVAVGIPFFRRWSRLVRWRNIDGYAFGLSIGLAFGRVGCYAVGEHFGRQSDFFLASRYDGGSVREPLLGDVRLVEGMTFHQTALYELLYLLVLFAGLAAAMWLRRRQGRELVPGTVVGVFVLYYGVARWLSDSLRVNDERVAGMTGAQWMALALIPAGLWILLRVRPQLATLVRAEAEDGAGAGTGEGEDGAEMDAEPHADDAPGAKSEAETDSGAGTGAGAEAGTEAETEDRAGSGTENGAGAGTGEGSESGVEDGAEVGTDAGAEAGAEASAEAETEGTSEPEASGSPADDAVRAVETSDASSGPRRSDTPGSDPLG